MAQHPTSQQPSAADQRLRELEVRLLEGLHTVLTKVDAAVEKRLSRRRRPSEAAERARNQRSMEAETPAPRGAAQEEPQVKDLVEEASEESFPASDPPSFTGSWSG